MKKNLLKKEAIIGLISILSLFILYFGINYLKGINIFQLTNRYYAKFNDVTELQNSSPIFIDGFKIGVVNNIMYDYNNPGNVIVEMNLDKNMKIQTGSYVELRVGFTTGASLNIILNQSVTNYCVSGDTIEGRSKLGLMDLVEQKTLPQIESMILKFDSILSGLERTINHPALLQSLEHIEQTTGNLSKTSKQLQVIFDKDIPSIVDNFHQISSDFAQLSTEIKSINLKQTFDSFDEVVSSLNTFSGQLNNPDNSLGLLLTDRQLYDNLNQTSINASELLFDLKKNPKRYVHFSVFGKK